MILRLVYIGSLVPRPTHEGNEILQISPAPSLAMSGEAEPPEAVNVVNFVEEAQQSLDEVRYAISAGWISEKLASTCECTYLNVTTLEGEEFCVRLSWRGFEVSELAKRGPLPPDA